MSDYNIPLSSDDLFNNGDNHYHIHDHDHIGDNVFSMNLFLETVGVPEEHIELYDGTQVFLNNGHIKLQIDAYGGGDLHLHEYDITTL